MAHWLKYLPPSVGIHINERMSTNSGMILGLLGLAFCASPSLVSLPCLFEVVMAGGS